MKITFLSPPFDFSGGCRVLATYAEKLHRRGHEVTVVAPLNPPIAIVDQLRSLARNRRLLRRLPREPSYFDEVTCTVRTLDRPRPIEDRDVPDADVVVSTWWETAEWMRDLSPSKGAKTMFIQHYEAWEHTPADRVDATWRLPAHKITISKWLVDLARNRFGDHDVTLIHNSVDTSQFHAPERARNRVSTVGLLYSGTPWKGCDVALAAIAEVRESIPDLRVVAFSSSDPAPKPDLPLPPGSTYEYLPPQARIPELYAMCDVWLCGSRGEGFHLPPLEAMACGCPVVSTAVGGSIDVVVEGKNGFIVPIGDSAALADRLRRVLALPPNEWRAMSDAALETATHYTWDDATTLFEAALRHSIERTKRGDFAKASVSTGV